MRCRRVVRREELVELVARGTAAPGPRDLEPDRAETGRGHLGQRSGDCVATPLEISNPLKDQISARQTVDVRDSVNAHALIVRRAPYVAVGSGRVGTGVR